MRILMIIDGLPGGGAEKTVLTLCEGIAKQGHQVTLLSLRAVLYVGNSGKHQLSGYSGQQQSALAQINRTTAAGQRDG
uniref:CAZy families GT4 protein n=1 Tax=uncultured Erwinia sp. TaxID=246798 RepID=A0A060CFK9_9GAMM|nr:CAZy families GT4 protein [uncultured Erwinia sp.]